MQHLSLREALAGLTPEQRFARYRELWALAGQREILTDYPMHLDLELSGLCNLRCEHCFQNGLLDGPLGLMDQALFQRIIDDGVERGLCAVKLQVRGESLLHPAFFDMAAYAKQRGVMDVQVTTNATLLDEARMERLLTSGLDAVIFSVDAHHGETFDHRHADEAYGTVEARVDRFLELRRERGLSRPWVRLRTSIPQADIRTSEETRAAMRNRFPLADIFIVGRLHDFRNDHDAFPDLHRNYVQAPCSYLFQRLAVFCDGGITVCCLDYNRTFGLGSVQDQGVAGVWQSPRLEAMRRAHLEGHRGAMPICRHCHACLTPRDGTFHDTTARHMAETARQEVVSHA